jgi:glutamine amidotransferase
MRVSVIDYKAGNLTSVVKALRHLGAEVEVTDGPEPLAKAERIILPGVGHFAATRRLDETGLTAAIREAIERGIPFLGICVGMQWLYAGSTEAPDQLGLAHFQEIVERFPDGEEKVPHVGWNQVEPGPNSRLMAGIEANEFAYFTHAWRAPITAATAATTSYIKPFASAVETGNVFGVQFHPEKSGDTGLRILKNFLLMKRDPSRSD